jgi:hypothetical protein
MCCIWQPEFWGQKTFSLRTTSIFSSPLRWRWGQNGWSKEWGRGMTPSRRFHADGLRAFPSRGQAWWKPEARGRVRTWFSHASRKELVKIGCGRDPARWRSFFPSRILNAGAHDRWSSCSQPTGARIRDVQYGSCHLHRSRHVASGPPCWTWNPLRPWRPYLPLRYPVRPRSHSVAVWLDPWKRAGVVMHTLRGLVAKL